MLLLSGSPACDNKPGTSTPVRNGTFLCVTVFMDIRSLQKVGGTCIRGHPHKQKQATF